MVLYCFPIENEVYSSTGSFEVLEGRQKDEKISHGKNELVQNQRLALYLDFFSKELAKNMEKYDKKNWEEKEDNFLVDLRDKGLNWVQISKQIPKTNPQICKRRYVRLMDINKKWPKQIDEFIKNGYEKEKKGWGEIYDIILKQRNEENVFYSIKKIKERYFLHLRQGIELKNWEIQEDLLLLNLIKDHGKKWKEFTQKFQGRTQLQLKNRYNGTLKLIEKRVLRKLNAHLKKQKQKSQQKIEK